MKTLTDFYRDYAAWLDAGAPRNDIFFKRYGLCFCLRRWLEANGVREYLKCDMDLQFIEAGLDPFFPFNDGEVKGYQKENKNHSCHLNPARVAWVREHAK